MRFFLLLSWLGVFVVSTSVFADSVCERLFTSSGEELFMPGIKLKHYSLIVADEDRREEILYYIMMGAEGWSTDIALTSEINDVERQRVKMLLEKIDSDLFLFDPKESYEENFLRFAGKEKAISSYILEDRGAKKFYSYLSNPFDVYEYGLIFDLAVNKLVAYTEDSLCFPLQPVTSAKYSLKLF